MIGAFVPFGVDPGLAVAAVLGYRGSSTSCDHPRCARLPARLLRTVRDCGESEITQSM